MSKRAIIIIGGGHSITKYLPEFWNDIEDQDIIAINHAYSQIPYYPKYVCSIDALFWYNFDPVKLSRLVKHGVQLVVEADTRTALPAMVHVYHKTKIADSSENLYSGSRNLSGNFALSFVCKKTDYTEIFLFGFDFGTQDGKTHFYDTAHNGQARTQAYLEKDKSVCNAVNEYTYYNQFGKNIYLVGNSKITAFKNINYAEFKTKIGVE